MERRREDSRSMCAELLTIRWIDMDGHSRSEMATLEDISPIGACLHMDTSIPPGTQISMQYPGGEYPAKVKYCIYQEIGYFLGIGFADGYRWSKEDFQPSHLLELPR